MPHVPSHSDVDFVIALCNGPNKGREWWYYLVDHRQRIIFWLHDYNLTKIFENVKGVTNKGHMKQAIITQYWIHVELYPNQLVLQAEDHQELQNVLNQAMADAITSNTSVTPLDTDVMAKMSELVDKFEVCIVLNSRVLPLVFIYLLGHTKFVNFSGQPCARLNVDQSIYRPSDGPSLSLIIRLFDLLLFGSASVHAEELERTWVDQIVNFPRWKAYISKLTTEWSGFTFYSTVLLAVDVSLLAIPALGGGGSSPTSAVINGNSTITTNTTTNTGPPSTSEETAAIISIYLSIFFVVGSLVTSIQLSDRIRGKEHSSAPEIVCMILLSMFDYMYSLVATGNVVAAYRGVLVWHRQLGYYIQSSLRSFNLGVGASFNPS
ncbi:hypothetical protein ID866_5634 [Astraeus odoratus]|nr:hypothetical protein ID866_5634 [Astraeus odoratus]